MNYDRTTFELIEGFVPVEQSEIADFQRAMNDAIPEIGKAIEKRRMLAAKSRFWHLTG